MKTSPKEIRNRFAPVEDPHQQAAIIADWSRFFFGDKQNASHYWINNSIPDVHYKIYEALSNEYEKYYITAPRGFGKSTVAQLIYVLYRIYYRLEPYIVLIEKIDKSGIQVLTNIKREIEKNPKLLYAYGQLKPERNEGLVWSSHEIRLRNGIFVRSIGMMGDIRGSLDASFRITLILGNDVQSIKTMNEPTTLQKHIEYWDRDVEPAIDPVYGKVRLVGNMLGSGCLLEYVSKDPEYSGINFSCLVDNNGNPDINGKSIWEDRFPTPVLHRKRDMYKAKGRLPVFMAEWMNIITDEGKKTLKGYKYHNAIFRNEFGQNIIHDEEYGDIPVYTYYWVDPAFSSVSTADARAAVIAALGRFPTRDYAGNIVWVNGCWILDYTYDHSDPSLLIDRGLDLHHKYHFRGIIIEANGPQEIYEYIGNRALLQDEFVFKNPINFIPVKHIIGSKIDRIYEEMQPRCRLGQFFIRPEHDDLQMELEMFVNNPNGIHILDAITMGLKYSDVCIEDKETFDKVNSRFFREQNNDFNIKSLLQSPNEVFRMAGLS